MPDIKSLTAAELLRLYRRKELSPVEVTRDQLDRIDKFQPALNAFIIVDRDVGKVDAQALARTQVRETWVAGKKVWEMK